jgi:hypothetical protein
MTMLSDSALHPEKPARYQYVHDLLCEQNTNHAVLCAGNLPAAREADNPDGSAREQ